MNLDDEMAAELDSFDWYCGGEDLWGDDAYKAFTSVAFGYAVDPISWKKYVNQMKLSGSRFLPSDRFCRRIALWFDTRNYVAWEQVDALDSDSLIRLFKKGWLARLDGVDLTAKQYAEAMQYVVRQKLWGADGSEFAFIYELLNHPQTKTSRVKAFSDAIFKEVSRTPLIATSVLAAHPNVDKDTLNRVASLYADGGLRVQPSNLNPLPEFLENTLYERRDQLNFGLRQSFNKPVEANMRNFYLSKTPLDRRLLTSSYEDICHEAWWQALYNTPGHVTRLNGGFKKLGARLEAGPLGMPPAVPLMISLRLLDAVERDDFLDEGTESSAGMWVLPYLHGARKWVSETFGTGDVPLAWLMQTLGMDENPSRDDWKFLSPAWLSNADARLHIGIPTRKSR